MRCYHFEQGVGVSDSIGGIQYWHFFCSGSVLHWRFTDTFSFKPEAAYCTMVPCPGSNACKLTEHTPIRFSQCVRLCDCIGQSLGTNR